jgi:hypothetical protein
VSRALPYPSLCVPMDADEELLETELQAARVAATIRDHGCDPDDFWAERTKADAEPVTLGELRDWLGY